MNVVLVAVVASAAFSVISGLQCVRPENSQAEIKRFLYDCFAIHLTEKLDFPSAQDVCKKIYGGTLAMPKKAQTCVILRTYLKNLHAESPLWIGLSDRKQGGGQFAWDDGSSLGNGYTRWLGSQGAQNLLVDRPEHCVAMRKTDDDYYWYDEKCTAPFGMADKNFVCQYDATD